MKYSKDIVDFFKDYDTGLGLYMDPDQKIAIIFSDKNEIDETFATISSNVYFVSKNIKRYEPLMKKYPGLKLVEGDLINTNLESKSINFVLTDSEIINYNCDAARNELNRISVTRDSEVVILDSEIKNETYGNITEDFLKFLYAGSGYETKNFKDGNHGDNPFYTKVYYSSIGFNESELQSKETIEFIEACENYCDVIVNFKNYTVKDFLYNVQKTLILYYLKGFELRECCGRARDTADGRDEQTRKQVDFPHYLNSLTEFLENVEPYYSNFNPYPEDDDEKEVVQSALALDLAEIYDDLKSNLIAFKNGNIYDKQSIIWDWKFNWQGHTGNHWTFAVRAIHWKLQDLEHEE